MDENVGHFIDDCSSRYKKIPTYALLNSFERSKKGFRTGCSLLSDTVSHKSGHQTIELKGKVDFRSVPYY